MQGLSCPDPHPELCSISLTRAQSTLKIIKQHSSLRVRLTFFLSHTSFKSSTHGLMKPFFFLGKISLKPSQKVKPRGCENCERDIRSAERTPSPPLQLSAAGAKQVDS